jgi:hypothetical protein
VCRTPRDLQRAARGSHAAFIRNRVARIKPCYVPRHHLQPERPDACSRPHGPAYLPQECSQHRTGGFARCKNVNIGCSLQPVDERGFSESGLDENASVCGTNSRTQDLLEIFFEIFGGAGQ